MNRLAGTVWKLIAARAFDSAGHELPSPLGPQPLGVAIFEVERLIATAADGRPSLPPDTPGRAFACYTGRYTFDGTTLTTSVDAASSPDMLADQVRRIRFESETRMVVEPVTRLFDHGAGLELVWQRMG